MWDYSCQSLFFFVGKVGGGGCERVRKEDKLLCLNMQMKRTRNSNEIAGVKVSPIFQSFSREVQFY